MVVVERLDVIHWPEPGHLLRRSSVCRLTRFDAFQSVAIKKADFEANLDGIGCKIGGAYSLGLRLTTGTLYK
jgi:hypothetical protein